MSDLGGPVQRLWHSAGLCSRGFGHSSLVRRASMFAVIVTATRRIQHPHAVATLNSADALSILAWGSWLVITLLALLASLVLAATAPARRRGVGTPRPLSCTSSPSPAWCNGSLQGAELAVSTGRSA